MRWLLALLMLLAGACSEKEGEPPVDPGSYEMPPAYMQTLLATQHEWVAAGMPFPEECVTMATRMTLYFDEWDETVAACNDVPSSAPPGWDSGVPEDALNHDPDKYRISACISSNETYEVHFDNGEPEGLKHMYFVHEVLHGLQYCSQRGRDGTHLDTYVWDVILPRARWQVACGGRSRFGETELEDVTCYDPYD